MEVLLYAILAIVGVGAAGFALVPAFAGSSRADKRMKALQGDIRANRQIAETTRNRDTRRKQIQDTLKAQNDQFTKTKRRIPLQDQLYQAGMKIQAKDWIRNQIIVGVVLAVVCWLLQVEWYFALIFGAAGGYLLPKFWMSRRK
jgi:tight adherence protein B